MSKELPAPTPQLNRLRAAAGLIPIIESGLANRSMPDERAAQMILFCQWAANIAPHTPEESRLAESVKAGLERLEKRLTTSADTDSVAA